MPGHLLPPCAGFGFVQVRCRIWNPLPQDAEQKFHALQTDQPPSTNEKKLQLDCYLQIKFKTKTMKKMIRQSVESERGWGWDEVMEDLACPIIVFMNQKDRFPLFSICHIKGLFKPIFAI